MIVSDFRFHKDGVDLRWPIGETERFRVTSPLRVSFYLDGKPISWTVPVRTPSDLASIPEIVPKWVAKKVDWHIPACIVHDEMCLSRPWTSQVAADIFNEAMKAIIREMPEEESEDAHDMRKRMYEAVARFGPEW